MDLFTYIESYPRRAGYKREGTSRQAASTVDTKTLKLLVLNELAFAPGTADEIASRLRIDKLSIRPRLSELSAEHRVEDSGMRRRNASGKSAIVYRIIALARAA